MIEVKLQPGTDLFYPQAANMVSFSEAVMREKNSYNTESPSVFVWSSSLQVKRTQRLLAVRRLNTEVRRSPLAITARDQCHRSLRWWMAIPSFDQALSSVSSALSLGVYLLFYCWSALVLGFNSALSYTTERNNGIPKGIWVAALTQTQTHLPKNAECVGKGQD